VEFAQALAAASNAVVYLKGSIGIIATPKGFVIATHRTCEHLATAGSGDVIAGFLASMLAHHQPRKKKAAAQIVAAAVIVHSLAAELVAIDGEPVIADDIEENLPAAIAQLTSD
jgi:NAD(P)H-hydrate repair Nnr-like enzyme with NAD(P)H-hydrate dehydratase domain